MSLSTPLSPATAFAATHLSGSTHRWQHEERFLPDGLPHSALHEVFLSEIESTPYVPASFIIAGITRALHANTSSHTTPKKITVWIGRDRWPTPYALPEDLRAHAYFLQPRTEKQFLWALDAALRSPAVGAVVTHYDRLPFTLSQRFALATRTSGAIGIFTRPQHALTAPSAAPFRWQITPLPVASDELAPPVRWKVTLLKAKQALPQNNTWIVDYEDETFSLRVPSTMVRGSSEALTEAHRTAFG